MFNFGERVRILHVPKWVLVEHYTRGKQTPRIEELFDPPHQSSCLRSPLLLQKWSDISSCSVLSLQGAVILADDECRHLFHEDGVLVDV